MRVRLSRAAGRDLDEIYDYTLQRWGSDQADAYVRSFADAYQLMSATPEAGAVSDIRPGYRKFRHREHLIFYQILPRSIEIRRILNPRMDVSRHLS